MFHYPVHQGRFRHARRGFAVVDVETSGLDPARARIIEIAIVRVDSRGRPLGEYETLVDPSDRDTGEVRVHGITAGMVQRAPRFAQIAPAVLAWLEGVVVVAHNAAFEDGFLAAELERCGLPPPPVPALDTLRLSQAGLSLPNHRLSTVCEWAGLRIDRPHTALGDARATAALLPHLLRQAPAPGWALPMGPLGGHMTGGYMPRDYAAHPEEV